MKPHRGTVDTGRGHSPGWRWARVPTGPGPGCACARGWMSPWRLARPALPQGLEGGTSLLGWKRRQCKWQAEHQHFCENGKSLLGHSFSTASIILLTFIHRNQRNIVLIKSGDPVPSSDPDFPHTPKETSSALASAAFSKGRIKYLVTSAYSTGTSWGYI